MGNFIFKDPHWLWALILLLVLMWLRNRRSVPVLLVPFAAAWHRPSLAARSRWPVALGLLGLALIIVALARPQRVEDKREVRTEGYDIVLAIDLSGSMLAEDYEKDGERINRLQAIKPVVQAFINERSTDRISVVVFAEQAYTLAPLTFDHDWIARQVERLRVGLVGPNRTAIGDGLGVALTRLEQAKWTEGGRRKGAFIVLLTDGVNNHGTLSPDQATKIAISRTVPIYTIGAGRDGFVPLPVLDEKGKKIGYQQILSDLDESTLRGIADATGGRFYRAAASDTIEQAFKAIDRTQKIEFQAKSYIVATELFQWVVIPGLAAFVSGALLARAPWRREVSA